MQLHSDAIIPWIRTHKRSAAAITIGLLLVGYGVVRAVSGGTAPVSYVLATVTRGTLVVAVSGNGQIAATSQVSLTPEGSGKLTYVAPVNGQRVRAGTIIASLDAADEAQAVQNARIDLDEAHITLEKLERNQVADIPTLTADIDAAYADAYDAVAAAAAELPDIRDRSDDAIHEGLTGGCASTVCEHRTDPALDALQDGFSATDRAYDAADAAVRAISRFSPHADIVRGLDATAAAGDALERSLEDQQRLEDAYIDDLTGRSGYEPRLTAMQALRSATATDAATLSRNADALRSAARAAADADRGLADAHTDGPLDLASQRNTVQRAELALQKAQKALGDRSVRAPFDGIVSGLDARRGDSVSGSTTLGSLVTDQHIAELTFNEVDIAKLTLGQKATLTFDAVDNLTLTGSVAAIDALGTVSQGVVSYTVQVALDAQDARIKPGMSVGAAIVTDVRTNALIVPIAAVKGSGDAQYVQIPGNGFPATATTGVPVAWTGVLDQASVTVGLTSDTEAEILSGLAENDRIITRTVTASTTTGSSQAPSLFQGATRGGTGSGRAVIR